MLSSIMLALDLVNSLQKTSTGTGKSLGNSLAKDPGSSKSAVQLRNSGTLAKTLPGDQTNRAAMQEDWLLEQRHCAAASPYLIY